MVSPIRLPLSPIRLPLRAKKNVWVSLDCVAYPGLVRTRRACRLVRTRWWGEGHGNPCPFPRLGGKGEGPVVVAVEGAEKLRSPVVVAVEGAEKLRWTQE